MLLRLLLSLMSPRGPRARLSILIFHRVLAQPDPLIPGLPTASEFELTMRWVGSWFNVLPLSEAVDRLYAGSIPSRALAITFDDGYLDNVELAAPILARLGMSATFFVSTGFLDKGCMWNDRVIEAVRNAPGPAFDLTFLGLSNYPIDSIPARVQTIDAVLRAIKHHEAPRRQQVTDAIVAAAGGPSMPALMMRPDQLRTLRSLGMDVGAHTVTHPILARLPSDAAVNEMRDSKREIERILGESVRLFAYPNGVPEKDYTSEHAAMARECGFDAAVSTSWGAASTSSDRFQLPRFTPWDRNRIKYGMRMIRNLTERERIAR